MCGLLCCVLCGVVCCVVWCGVLCGMWCVVWCGVMCCVVWCGVVCCVVCGVVWCDVLCVVVWCVVWCVVVWCVEEIKHDTLTCRDTRSVQQQQTGHQTHTPPTPPERAHQRTWWRTVSRCSPRGNTATWVNSALCCNTARWYTPPPSPSTKRRVRHAFDQHSKPHHTTPHSTAQHPSPLFSPTAALTAASNAKTSASTSHAVKPPPPAGSPDAAVSGASATPNNVTDTSPISTRCNVVLRTAVCWFVGLCGVVLVLLCCCGCVEWF